MCLPMPGHPGLPPTMVMWVVSEKEAEEVTLM